MSDSEPLLASINADLQKQSAFRRWNGDSMYFLSALLNSTNALTDFVTVLDGEADCFDTQDYFSFVY